MIGVQTLLLFLLGVHELGSGYGAILVHGVEPLQPQYDT